MFDLDSAQEKRIDKMWKSWGNGGSIAVSDVFLSGQVAGLIDEQKIALDTFAVDKILSVIPFCNAVFVHICPVCINNENFDVFRGLVGAGLIFPVFTSQYHYYPDQVVQTVAAKPHISTYEFDFFKTVVLFGQSDSEEMLCNHCIDKRKIKLRRLVDGKRHAPAFRAHLDTIVRNIEPYVAPDFDILDELKDCFRERDLDRSQQIVDTSYAIRAIRNSQTLQAPLLLTDQKIEQFAAYKLPELVELGRVGIELRELIAHDLGLKVPTNMPIDDYVGLMKDIRPQMQSIMSKMLQPCQNSSNEISLSDVFEGIGDVNRDIERILQSKRYLFLEAAVSVISNNKPLLASALVAAGLGLSGNLVSCGATAIGGVIGNELKKKMGKSQSNQAVKSLGQAIHRDLQPALRKVIATYVGATEVPLQVMAVRERIRA